MTSALETEVGKQEAISYAASILAKDQMKLSQETMAVLKHLSTITRSLFVAPGNVLKVRKKALYVEAPVSEDFPIEFGLPDLDHFLRTLALFTDPVLEFGPEDILIMEADGTAKIRYIFATAASMNRLSTNRKKVEPLVERIIFTITEDLWAQMNAALGEDSYMRVISDGNSVRIVRQDRDGTPSPVEVLGTNVETRGHTCNMVFDRENLPLMAGSYEITVYKHCTQFKTMSGYDLLYLVGPEPGSSLWGGELAVPPIETKQLPPTREAYMAKVQNQELMRTKANALNKSTVFDVLAAAGATNVTIEFDGEGDSGQIDDIAISQAEDSTALLATLVTISEFQWNQQNLSLVSTTLEDALERLCYCFLEQKCGGWEINEGSYGVFEFDVVNRVINLDFNERIIDSNHYSHIF